MKYTLSTFYQEQFSTIPPIESMSTDLSGKTVIIVGANTGLGFECARHIASMMGQGPKAGRLILACRSEAKGIQALRAIHESTTYDSGEIWMIDLMDFESISAFASRFEKEGGGSLDLLIENSGIATSKYTKSKHGWESTIQTNHLGTALLALLMIPHLSRATVSAPFPRLTIVASDVHYFTKLYPNEVSSPRILEKLNDEEYCKSRSVMFRRYSVSKLLNIFFMRALSKRIPASNPLVVNAVNPSYCRSSLNSEAPALLVRISYLLARSTEEGGRKLVHAALTKELNKALPESRQKREQYSEQFEKEGQKIFNGKFFSHCVIAEESDYVISDEGGQVQERLWKETLEILEKEDHRVQEIVHNYLI